MLLASSPAAWADVSDLRARHAELVPVLASSALPEPLHVESREVGDRAAGDVYSELPFGIDVLRRELARPGAWCEIVSLHVNVKACTHSATAGAERLTLFAGPKHYQSPDQAERLEMEFRAEGDDPDALHVVASAERGPFGSSDYRIELTAIPIDAERSLVHFHYAYAQGFWTRNATHGYLRTLGRKKVGFSVVDRDAAGQPVYVKGVAGMLERNAVRYHLAILAYLETLSLPEADRFEQRIERWYERADHYRRQLYDIDRRQYLSDKRRGWRDQLRLQAALESGAPRQAGIVQP